MQFADGIHPHLSSLDFFQQYFKANLNFLSTIIKKMTENYELIDWTKVLYEAGYYK